MNTILCSFFSSKTQITLLNLSLVNKWNCFFHLNVSIFYRQIPKNDYRYFLNLFRYSNYLAKSRLNFEKKSFAKDQNYIKQLISKRFCFENFLLDSYIFYLSSFNLSVLEKVVLSKGLDFCIPFEISTRQKFFSEFEVMFSQLILHVSSSTDQFKFCKSGISPLSQ